MKNTWTKEGAIARYTKYMNITLEFLKDINRSIVLISNDQYEYRQSANLRWSMSIQYSSD